MTSTRETMIARYAGNLKLLRGFQCDWSRNDANFDHVYANQAFTRKLNEFGIIHGAEEYNGAFGESDWGVDGRSTLKHCHSSKSARSSPTDLVG